MGKDSEKKNMSRIVVLYCQNSISKNADIETITGHLEDIIVEPVMMVCSSKIQVSDLLKILDNGADAVEVIACPEKACGFLTGSRKADKRMEYAKSLLCKIDVNTERLSLTYGIELSVDEIIEIARKRAEIISS